MQYDKVGRGVGVGVELTTRHGRLEAVKALGESRSRFAIPRLYMLLHDRLTADKAGRFCDYAADSLAAILPDGPGPSLNEPLGARDQRVEAWMRYLNEMLASTDDVNERIAWVKQLIGQSDRLVSEWAQPSALGAALMAQRILRQCSSRNDATVLLADVQKRIPHLQNAEMQHLNQRLKALFIHGQQPPAKDLRRPDAIAFNLHFAFGDPKHRGQKHITLDPLRLKTDGSYCDAWGNPIRFVYPAPNNLEHFQVYSCGPDGKDDAGGGDDITGYAGRSAPAWSAGMVLGKDVEMDRVTILFSTYVDKVHYLHTMNLGDLKRTDLGEGSQGVWSSDGRRIAFTHGSGGKDSLFVMNADGTNRQLVTDKFAIGYDGIAWSPDDARIVFTVEFVKDGPVPPGAMQLAIVNVDGSEGRMLTNDRHWYFWPHFVSDRVVMVTKSEHYNQPYHAASVDVGAGTLEDTWPRNASYCRWSPDGKYIAYADTADGGLTVRPAEGGDPMVLLHSHTNITMIHWLGSSRLLFAANGVHSVRIDGSGHVQLYDYETGTRPTSAFVADE